MEPSNDGRKAQLSLRGRLTNTCLQIQEIRVIDSGKSIEILPIMEKKDPAPQAGCQRVEVPFDRRVDLPAKARGRYLVHVRSLDGQSLNVIFARE